MLWAETLLPGLGLSGQVFAPFHEAHSAPSSWEPTRTVTAFVPLLTNIPSRKVEYPETFFTVDTTNVSFLKTCPPPGYHLDSFTSAHTIKVQHRTSRSHPVIQEKPQNTSSIVCFQSCCFNKGRCEKEERMPFFNNSCRLKPQGHASGMQPSMAASLSRMQVEADGSH